MLGVLGADDLVVCHCAEYILRVVGLVWVPQGVPTVLGVQLFLDMLQKTGGKLRIVACVLRDRLAKGGSGATGYQKGLVSSTHSES